MSLTQSTISPSVHNNVQILTVDNDRDSGALYTALLEPYGIAVMATESIQEALDLLNRYIPDVLVCEARFLGESVYPLIQKVRSIARNQYKVIPIFVTSTCPAMNLAEQLAVRVEAYRMKPVDLDQFVNEIWNLILLSQTFQPFILQDWLAKLNIDKTPLCCT